MRKSVSLYSFEYCSSNLGLWSRAWFATNAEADAARRKQIERDGRDPDEIEEDEELTGEHGQVGKVACVEVALTAAGVLTFAQHYGTADE